MRGRGNFSLPARLAGEGRDDDAGSRHLRKHSFGRPDPGARGNGGGGSGPARADLARVPAGGSSPASPSRRPLCERCAKRRALRL